MLFYLYSICFSVSTGCDTQVDVVSVFFLNLVFTNQRYLYGSSGLRGVMPSRFDIHFGNWIEDSKLLNTSKCYQI